MTATPPRPPHPALPDVQLAELVLDLGDGGKLCRPARDFLAAWGEGSRDAGQAEARGGSEHELLRSYFETLWPEGLVATLYASNAESRRNVEHHYLDLALRPLSEGPRAKAAAVGGHALALRVQRQQRRLVVRRVELVPHVGPRPFEARLVGTVRWSAEDRYMSREDLDALNVLPLRRARTAERLAPWQAYLVWHRALVEGRRVRLAYEGWRRVDEHTLELLVSGRALGECKRRRGDQRIEGTELELALESDGDDSTSEAAGLEDSPGVRRGTGRQKRRQRARGTLEIEAIVGRRSREGSTWSGAQLEQEHRILRVNLDQRARRLLESGTFPDSGKLVENLSADLAPIARMQGGVGRLQRDQGHSPLLADWLFDAASAGLPDPAEVAQIRAEIRAEIEAGADPAAALNTGQIEAVAKALAAPDLCLIQGPPGTGKTTVIAQICRRLALSGRRVLVASQSNLAVDNVLARLPRTPAIRPLRVAKVEKVDEAFRDLMGSRVVSRWFEDITSLCRERVAAGEAEEEALTQQRDALRRLKKIHRDHAASLDALAAAGEEEQQAHERWEQAREAADEVSEAQATLARHREQLQALARWADGAGARPRTPPAQDHELLADQPSPERLDTLDRARASRSPLANLRRALESAKLGGAADHAAAQELHELRAEKRALVDRHDAEGLERLGKVNRRIGRLEASGWNAHTGAIGRALRDLPKAPHALHVLADALSPGPESTSAIEEGLEWAQGHLTEVELAEAELAELRERWMAAAQGLETELGGLTAEVRAVRREQDASLSALEAARARTRSSEESTGSHREAWAETWSHTCRSEDPQPPTDSSLELASKAVQRAGRQARKTLGPARRWRSIQQDWCRHLESADEEAARLLEPTYHQRANVVGMTCLEAGKPEHCSGPTSQPFDVVIVDEVSKATPPELLLPLLLGRKAILVGDHRQLPPMFPHRDVSFEEEAEGGKGAAISRERFEGFRSMVTASLFEELFASAPAPLRASLWTQYRMHPTIMAATNVFYDDRLVAGPDAEQRAAASAHGLQVPDASGGALVEPGQHLLWIDSSRDNEGRPSYEEQRGSSKVHRREVELVEGLLVRLGCALLQQGYGAKRGRKEVGVITLYGAQLGELRKAVRRLERAHPAELGTMDLRCDTVDRFQGMEQAIVVVSLVRSCKGGRLGSFSRAFQRINVALSRARDLLVIVAARETWRGALVPLPPVEGGEIRDVPAYSKIMELADQAGGRRHGRQVST